MQKCKKCPGIKKLNYLLSQLQGQGLKAEFVSKVKLLNKNLFCYCDASNIASEQ